LIAGTEVLLVFFLALLQSLHDRSQHLGGSGVSVVKAWPPPSRTPVLHYAQSSLHMIEEIGNRIEVVAARSECSEDCKVNKNDCKEDWDNIDSITEEGVGVGVTDSETAGLVLCDKVRKILCNVSLSGATAGSSSHEEKEDQEIVHYVGLR